MRSFKILSLIIVICTVLSLAACDMAKDDSTETGTTAQTESGSESSSNSETETEPEGEEYSTITIAEALEKCGESGNVTEERYYIRGIIKTVTNAQYGAMVISDDTGEIAVYGTYSSDGSVPYADMDEKPYKGDEVLLHCILQNYNGTKEIKNARLIEFKSNQGNFDLSEYKDATISEARAANTGDKVKVSGIVARITYANGMKPNGFILVNGIDSIYVFDRDAAGMVKVGNRVEIAASKTYWILDTEMSNAQTHGYKGCNQLEDATVISNDNGENDWMEADFPEAAVKEIMDNPVSNDITTQIYKVTALVKKAEGKGFTNYYIDDLDEVTGSYTYTQCNGSDFAWLDEFDGKICTVYLVALNAKSTHSDCIYRFLPVAVKDDGYEFDTNKASEFAVVYHGMTQFASTYTGDPALELVSEVSSALLGFEGATLTYTSSDESVISIVSENGKTVMNCLKSGSAEITVTAAYNGKTFSDKITVTADIPETEIPAISVEDAIDAAVGEVITVKGIVGPSLVNQSGFYLIDENGVIAVTMTDDQLEKVKLGDEVILRGTRAIRLKDGSSCYGQTNIDSCEVLVNNYGNRSYASSSFIYGKTVADFVSLSTDEDHTTEVYVLTANVKVVDAQYYSNIYISDGTNDILLYCNSSSQYSWLKAYAGQEVTLEIAPCNWNSKTSYRGCVLAVITEDGKICNELNFNK